MRSVRRRRLLLLFFFLLKPIRIAIASLSLPLNLSLLSNYPLNQHSRDVGCDLGPEDHRRGQPGRALLPGLAALFAFRRNNAVAAVADAASVVSGFFAAEDGSEPFVRGGSHALDLRRRRFAPVRGRSLGAPGRGFSKGRREHAARGERRRFGIVVSRTSSPHASRRLRRRRCRGGRGSLCACSCCWKRRRRLGASIFDAEIHAEEREREGESERARGKRWRGRE